MDREPVDTVRVSHRVAGWVWRGCAAVCTVLLAMLLAVVLGESVLAVGVYAWLDRWSPSALILLGILTLLGLAAYWTWSSGLDRDVPLEMVLATMQMTDEELIQAFDALGRSHRQLLGEGRLEEAAKVDADRLLCLNALVARSQGSRKGHES